MTCSLFLNIYFSKLNVILTLGTLLCLTIQKWELDDLLLSKRKGT